jgi:AraC-like DNA-binding protein
MKIETFLPCLQLNEVVEKIIYLENNSKIDLESQMIPRGFPAFIFTFPDQPAIENKLSAVQRFYKPARLYFNGIVTASVYTKFYSGSSFIVVQIRPHCSSIFFQEDAYHFINQLYDITDIDQESRDVMEEFSEKEDIRDKINIVNRYLLKRLKNMSVCPVINRSMILISSGVSYQSVKELALNTYASERTLRRKFVQQLGLAPKQYLSILKFRKLIKYLTTNAEVDWWQVAMEFDYYDLSHLSKDFRKYTSISPEDYLLQYHSIDAKMIPTL